MENAWAILLIPEMVNINRLHMLLMFWFYYNLAILLLIIEMQLFGHHVILELVKVPNLCLSRILLQVDPLSLVEQCVREEIKKLKGLKSKKKRENNRRKKFEKQ